LGLALRIWRLELKFSIEFSLRKSLRKIRGTRKSAHQVHHKPETSPHGRRPRHTFPAKITCKLTRNRVLGLEMGYVWDWHQKYGGSVGFPLGFCPRQGKSWVFDMCTINQRLLFVVDDPDTHFLQKERVNSLGIVYWVLGWGMSGIGTPNMAARAQISIEFSLRKSLRKIRGTRKSAHQVHHKTVTSPHSRRPRHTFPAKITCKLTRNRVLGLGMGYVWDWEQEHGGSGWSVGGGSYGADKHKGSRKNEYGIPT